MMPRAATATSSRPRLREPGGTSSPRCRIATNAEAQVSSVNATAAIGSQGRGVLTGERYGWQAFAP
jgi:hypothetical protein